MKGQFPSAKEAYRAKLLEIAQMSETQGDLDGSRLGLVRIAYEGNCTLRAEVAGGVLKVTADSSF